MKKYFYYLTIILLVSFISCSDDDDEPVVYDLTLDGTDATNGLELLEGTSGEVFIKSGNGDYAVASSNKDVAVASIEDNKITVIAYSMGTTVLTITDKHKSVNITVTVAFNDALVVIPDSEPSAAILAKGFYVANEDWTFTDDGSVNYFHNDGTIDYRVYRSANDGEKFGVTTCFATIYGDYTYFLSKQGNRFVVAENKTLKKKAVLTEIGGDGRSFLGVSDEKGYIGTLNGVTVYNIKDFTKGSAINGISGQVGNMCLVGNRAFIMVQSKGVYVVNTTTNEIEEGNTISGSFNCMTQSKDGNIWIGTNTILKKVNPYTLETTDINITGSGIDGSWGAWNAGSLCASSKENVLYWRTGTKLVKYAIDSKTLTPDLYTLGKDEADVQLAFYGAALRVDPISDKLVLTVKRSGWGTSGSYNWVHIISNTGALEKNIVVRGDNGKGAGHGTSPTVDGNYYWFPAMPFFEDNNAPEILLNQIIVEPNGRKAICLSDKIVDADNMSTAIVKSISYDDKEELVNYELKQDSLIVNSLAKTGRTKLTIKANSNGKIVEKEIRVDVRDNK